MNVVRALTEVVSKDGACPIEVHSAHIASRADGSGSLMIGVG
jgi:hypothetical protein